MNCGNEHPLDGVEQIHGGGVVQANNEFVAFPSPHSPHTPQKVVHNVYSLFAKIAGIASLWFICSALTNGTNKVILTIAPYPITLTMIQFMTIILYCLILIKFKLVRVTNLKMTNGTILRKVIPLSVGHIGTRLFHQFALEFVPVSFVHTVKATAPIFAIILSRALMNERHSFKVIMTIFPIIGGVAIAATNELNFHYIGFVSALCGTCSITLLNVFTKRLLVEKRLTEIQLLLLTDMLGICLLTPFWILLEGVGLFQHIEEHGTRLITLVFLNGFCYFGQVLLAFALINTVSNLTYSVCSVSKRVFVILMAVMYFGNEIKPLNAFGIALAIVGTFLYSKLNYDEMAKHKKDTRTTYENILKISK